MSAHQSKTPKGGSKGRRFTLDTTALVGYREGLEKKQAAVLSGIEGEVEIPLERLQVAPWNARRYFNPKRLDELAQDLKLHGQIHAVLVRPLEEGVYQVVVGERRLRAAALAGLKALRARIRTLSDSEAYSLSLAENLDREDLSTYEETLGYLQRLVLELTGVPAFEAWRKASEEPQGAVVRALHKLHNERRLPPEAGGSIRGTELERRIREVFERHQRISLEAFYKHRLPILGLPEELQRALREGQLEYSKARLIARLPDAEARKALLRQALEHNLSLSALRGRISTPADSVGTLHGRAARVARRLKRGTLSEAQREKAEALLAELEALLGQISR
ncbi:MAG: ParB/RepB/Spo0J family partition protein [Thermaceae bacterium]|nr:ParB/RepB/Spo0J family partition protein [Thermaceae bacterium]